MKTDINKNANGDINRLAAGDINRLATGDINRNAEGDENPKTDVPEKTTTEDDNPVTVVEVTDGSFKDKLLSKTNNIGVTQDGKLTRTFAWGALAGILLFVGYVYAKRKGHLNFMNK